MGIGFFVGIFGVSILAHAAYSTVQYRGLLKIMEEEFSNPPMNVVIELLLGLFLCLWAALTVPGKFLSIHPDSDENSLLMMIMKEKIEVTRIKKMLVSYDDDGSFESMVRQAEEAAHGDEDLKQRLLTERIIKELVNKLKDEQ